MSDLKLLNQIEQIIHKLTGWIEDFIGYLGAGRNIIIEHFGQNGLIAAYVVLAVVILIIVSRLAKITFSTFKYLVIPAVVLAVLGSFIFPYSFFMILPVTVSACSLILLFKA